MQTHRWVDFYAKSVALLGLSGLAATGALVDNWPVLGNFPDVQLAEHWLGSPAVQTITEFPALPPSPVTFRPVMAKPAGQPLSSIHTRWTASFRPVTRRAESEESARVLPVPGVVGVPDLPAFELAAMPDPLPAVDTWPPMPAPAMTAASADENLFSAALRKTSSSLTASLDKARTSLVDVVRIVKGAVRRAF